MYNIVKTSISNSGFVCLGEWHSKFTNFMSPYDLLFKFSNNNRKTKQKLGDFLMNKIKFLVASFALVLGLLTPNTNAMELTAYTHTGSVMANGEYPYVGAVASNDFALGTVLNINGYNYVVADRMAPGIHGVVDIFVDSYDEAIEFGRQYGEVYVVG